MAWAGTILPLTENDCKNNTVDNTNNIDTVYNIDKDSKINKDSKIRAIDKDLRNR